MGGNLQADAVPVLAPGVQIVAVGGRLLADFGLEMKYLGDGDADDFGPLLALIDGKRTVGDICAALADQFEPDDVREAIAELLGDAIRLAGAKEEPAPWRHPFPAPEHEVLDSRLLVVGTGALADAIRTRLLEIGFCRVVHRRLGEAAWSGAGHDSGVRVLASATPPTGAPYTGAAVPALDAAGLAAALADTDVVIACAENELLAGTLAVNAACLRAGTPAIYATVDRDAIVVGPTVLPWRTACFECARLSACRLLREGDLDPAALRVGRAFAPPDPRAFAHVLAMAAFDVAREVCSLLLPEPVPAHFSSLAAYGHGGAPEARPIDLTTECTSCHGANPGGVHVGRPEAPPVTDPGWARRPAVPSVGGTRSVDETDAKALALGALDALHIRLDWRDEKHQRTLTRYPALQGTHFGQVTATQVSPFAGPLAARDGSSAVAMRSAARTGIGKGPTADQAWCSTVYEWFERSIFFPPGVRLVRASAREVEGLSIDLQFYLQRPIPHYDDNESPLYAMDEPIDWVWGHCLATHRPILIPARVAFPYDGAWFRGSKFLFPTRGSSGVAGGCTLDDAVLQGLLEVIEHDAWFSSIMTGVQCPSIEPTSIEDPLARGLIADLDAAGFDVLLRWISNDIGIPVVEANAIARDSYTHYVNSGWGAHVEPAIAVRRALSESVQSIMFFAGALRGRSVSHSPNAVYKTYADLRQRIWRAGPPVRFDQISGPTTPAATPLDYVDVCVARIRAAIPRADVCFYDLSACYGRAVPPNPGVYVANVFVSGTQDEVGQATHFTDRLLGYRRIMGDDKAPPFAITDLYLGRKELG